ncbi:MAG: D-alanyl-D-alanine carboxypeptidase/D-alanyl-D-alanine-endopeptidase [Gammaproteobacteria bacterium CG_4_10_14_0_8_um_filter_38_16]|nr:MAG: D-alanyl-D-alanine carboxypeptidase/D-alanyl-D-alanine-endopeptidase [Gammaproteobacteria bacterium CG_4_10_14_0_8_um_filter_38_16]PJA03936.1 MAG: D-alanyl-D-alanine carboxypeptidase/D-alanyl-D-alanine-endopeptidase [Gammaproteobacteria bacterium CG_4_10_14_0_2_um_filter_38_22]PJB09737.1 MAG: D-alanyl-D-alanine carboxypeptidase/D-alanyl-D-alanine-endopeptidase [Gammaproteobacteria bacterium CG_4_9_14_3_um_filter_38_9]
MPNWRQLFSLRVKKYLVAVFIFIITTSGYAQPMRCNSLSLGLHKLLAHKNPNVHIGVFVQSMRTGHVYFSKNAYRFFAPASVQKLFTVSAALINLKPSYRFPTRLLTDGKISQGILHGDLIFQFNGDPSLTEDTLTQFVKKLRALGIHRINGNIIIDDTAFNHIPYPPGWIWDDLSFDFAAPLNTVIIDRNQFGLSFVPAPRAGEKPILVPHLPNDSATFINQAITTNYPKRNCPTTIYSNENNQYLIRGCLARNQGTQNRSLAIRNLQMFTRGLIFELLRQNDIRFMPHVYYAKTPPNSSILAEHFSAPLSQLIVHLLKVSDNLYADALLKKMGEHYSHAQGSWQNGLAAVRPVLAKDIGINLNQIQLNDGSGLSRYNMVTPYSIAQLLNYIAHSPMLRKTLIPALPIAGVDGTLADRMPDMARHKRLHAKTGSMTGVSTLAGFINTKHHGLLSFVIMINNVPKNRFPYILLENHICEFLMQTGSCY